MNILHAEGRIFPFFNRIYHLDLRTLLSRLFDVPLDWKCPTYYWKLWSTGSKKKLTPHELFTRLQFTINFTTTAAIIWSHLVIFLLLFCEDGILIQLLCFWTLFVVQFVFKTQRFGDWILSPSSGRNYSVEPNRLSWFLSPENAYCESSIFICVSVRPYVSFTIPLDEFRLNLTLGLRSLCCWGNSTSAYLVTPRASTFYKI
jgi:hypothetical protein